MKEYQNQIIKVCFYNNKKEDYFFNLLFILFVDVITNKMRTLASLKIKGNRKENTFGITKNISKVKPTLNRVISPKNKNK